MSRLQWRKILSTPSTRFLLLGGQARCLASELLRYVDADGGIDVGLLDPVTAVWRLIGARKDERRWLKAATVELADAGFLEHAGHRIVLRTPDVLGAEPEPTRHRPGTDLRPTRSRAGAELVPTRDRAGAGDLPKSAQPLDPAPTEEKREEEKREDKKEENTEHAGVETASLRRVFDHWVGAVKRDPARTKLTRDRAAKIRGRLREGYTPEDLMRAIDGCAKSEWHMGANDRQTPFNDLTTICRSAETVDRHIAHLTAPPRKPGKGGPAPARAHHEFNDDDPDVIWGPRGGTANEANAAQ